MQRPTQCPTFYLAVNKLQFMCIVYAKGNKKDNLIHILTECYIRRHYLKLFTVQMCVSRNVKLGKLHILYAIHLYIPLIAALIIILILRDRVIRQVSRTGTVIDIKIVFKYNYTLSSIDLIYIMRRHK